MIILMRDKFVNFKSDPNSKILSLSSSTKEKFTVFNLSVLTSDFHLPKVYYSVIRLFVPSTMPAIL